MVVIQSVDVLRQEYNNHYKYDKFDLNEKLVFTHDDSDDE